MAEYYLISQLPSLDGIGDESTMPITEDRFLDVCQRLMSETAYGELTKLSLTPSRVSDVSSSELINAWNNGEKNLRLALGKVRAEKMNKQFQNDSDSFSSGLIQTVRTATEMESPMEAEKVLHRYRLDFLETLRPLDVFSEEYLFYYWLKLKLLTRIKKFDTASGRTAYTNIYNSIINGERLEVV